MDKYTFTAEIDVRDYELDSEGIVNNAVYLHYMEHTRHAFCRWAGFSFAQMQAEGLVPVVNRIEVDYRSPLRSGDTMLSRLWVEMRGVRFVFHHDIFVKSSGALAVRGVVSVVCLADGRLTRGERLREAFGKYLTQP